MLGADDPACSLQGTWGSLLGKHLVIFILIQAHHSQLLVLDRESCLASMGYKVEIKNDFGSETEMQYKYDKEKTSHLNLDYQY